MSTRKPAVAGMFYPGTKEEIDNMLKDFFKNVNLNLKDVKLDKEIKAIIVPHAGYVYSGQVAAYGYSLLKTCNKKKVILLGPSHTAYLQGIASDQNDYWETPLGKVKLAGNDFLKIAEAHLQEHCIEVQLPFLQKILGDFEIIPLLAGDIDPKTVSEEIKDSLDNDTLLIISSDLSHYLDYDTAVKLDNNTNKAIEALDYIKMEKEGEACGKIPVLAIIDLAKKLNWRCKLLNYQNSGDVTGDKSRVVGYSSFVLW